MVRCRERREARRGHRKRRTTALYAHLDDAALSDAAAQAGAVIAAAMGYRAEPPPLPHETDCGGNGERPGTPAHGDAGAAPHRPPERPDRMRPEASPGAAKAGRAVMDGLARKGAAPACGAHAQTVAQAARRTRCIPI